MAKPQFVGEQDGPVELELKARLISVFGRRRSVQAAYLARVLLPGQAEIAVALCLRAEPGNEQLLVGEVGGIFSGLFSPREQLDILFLNEDLESDLRTRCLPFYSQS